MFRLIKNLIVLVIVFFIGYFFGIKGIRFFRVASSSMEPTLNINDKIICEKTENIKRKDIVVLYAPKGEREILIKRVIGLGGEKIKIKNGYVYINGEILEEPYIMEKPSYELEETEIPFNSYFLLGDNRNQSEDSSIWGPVNKKYIIGKVIIRYYPFKNFRIF
ncbi:MAG: signal peptidase I [Candidatus Omnitrophica bacterium]|nr:signal peptidase I [Candidatus Omnitrophota bacterium]